MNAGFSRGEWVADGLAVAVLAAGLLSGLFATPSGVKRAAVDIASPAPAGEGHPNMDRSVHNGLAATGRSPHG